MLMPRMAASSSLKLMCVASLALFNQAASSTTSPSNCSRAPRARQLASTHSASCPLCLTCHFPDTGSPSSCKRHATSQTFCIVTELTLSSHATPSHAGDSHPQPVTYWKMPQPFSNQLVHLSTCQVGFAYHRQCRVPPPVQFLRDSKAQNSSSIRHPNFLGALVSNPYCARCMTTWDAGRMSSFM